MGAVQMPVLANETGHGCISEAIVLFYIGVTASIGVWKGQFMLEPCSCQA